MKPRSVPISYATAVRRLARASIDKHYDPYGDIAWDDPGYRMELDDHRWEFECWDSAEPLGATDWYRSQHQRVRARLGLHTLVQRTRMGVEFEILLIRGLLRFVESLRMEESAEWHYINHEIAEESQHILMFSEFIRRCQLPTQEPNAWLRLFGNWVTRQAKVFPELFFMFVLAGETPIDHNQRQALTGEKAHPLLRKIMQIHVTEEARHISFAEQFLRLRVPALSRIRKSALTVMTPILLRYVYELMMGPPGFFVTTYRIPECVLKDTYGKNPRCREIRLARLSRVRRLCEELNLLPRKKRLWTLTGLV